jgi:hypothetical protein
MATPATPPAKRPRDWLSCAKSWQHRKVARTDIEDPQGIDNETHPRGQLLLAGPAAFATTLTHHAIAGAESPGNGSIGPKLKEATSRCSGESNKLAFDQQRRPLSVKEPCCGLDAQPWRCPSDLLQRSNADADGQQDGRAECAYFSVRFDSTTAHGVAVFGVLTEPEVRPSACRTESIRPLRCTIPRSPGRPQGCFISQLSNDDSRSVIVRAVQEQQERSNGLDPTAALNRKLPNKSQSA